MISLLLETFIKQSITHCQALKSPGLNNAFSDIGLHPSTNHFYYFFFDKINDSFLSLCKVSLDIFTKY